MALLLDADNLSKSYGPRLLFSGISIAFADGERAGLIGPNGSGKSTLMKILAGLEQADTGTIVTRRNLRLGYVPQADEFNPAASVEQVLLDALSQEHMEAQERHARVQILMGKMGFERPELKTAELSGGWRKRLSIARQLVREPDLLLLDEPTNHLDLEGVIWLERLLRTASFAYILVSHDRYLLENVCRRIVELSRAYPQGYLSIDGPYSRFLERRQEFLAAQASEQQAIESRVRREIAWLQRGAKARTTKAKGRIEQADQMMRQLAELRIRNAQQRSAEIDFSATGRQTRKLLVAKGVSKTLGGRALFKDLDLVLSPGMKLGLLGNNGSGKTTLIRILTGELSPDSGSVKPAENLRIVWFDQNREQLDQEITLKTALSPKSDTVVYREKAMHVAGWARRFLFRTEQLDLPISQLSGGEQARVLVARMMLRPADVLILDEPTNDLDIPTLEVLEESLTDFPGALLLVSHDRYLIESLCTDLIGLDGAGGWGTYGDWSQWERAIERRTSKPASDNPEPARKAGQPAAPSAKPKRLTWNEQREWEQIEQKIFDAEEQVNLAQREMESPATLSDRDKLHAACERLHQAQETVAQLYARWEELETKRGG